MADMLMAFVHAAILNACQATISKAFITIDCKTRMRLHSVEKTVHVGKLDSDIWWVSPPVVQNIELYNLSSCHVGKLDSDI